MDNKAILKDGIMLSGRRFWAAAFGFVFTYMSASLLGPKGLGFLAILRLIPSLATFFNFGWIEASCREILHLSGLGQRERGRQIRAVAYTAESGIGVLWVGAILVYAFFYPDLAVRCGIVIAAVSMVCSLLNRFLINDMTIDKDFQLQAKVGLLSSTLNCGLGLLGAWLGGALGLFAAITFVQIIDVVIYWWVRGFSFSFLWDRRELWRLSRIGLPLAILAFFGSSAGVNLWIERSVIGAYGGLELLGLFVFSIAVINQMDMLTGEFIVSFQSHFWESLAQNPGKGQLFDLVYKPSVILAYLTAGLSVLVLAIVPPLITLFLSKYREMLNVLLILVATGMVGALYKIPSILLKSSFANNQTYFMFSRMASTAIYGAILWLLVAHAKFGLLGAALSVLAMQIVMTGLTLSKAYRYFLENKQAVCRFLAEQIMPMLFVVVVYLLCVGASGWVKSKNELLNLLWVSIPLTVIALSFLGITLERKTALLSRIYKMIRQEGLAHSISKIS